MPNIFEYETIILAKVTEEVAVVTRLHHAPFRLFPPGEIISVLTGKHGGDGIYRTEVNCSKYAPLDIFCDMTNKDGGWMRIMGKAGSTGMRNYHISADFIRYLFEDSKKEIAVSAEETSSVTEPAWRLSDVRWSLSYYEGDVWQAASNVANGLTPRDYNWGNTTKGYFQMSFQLDKTASGYNYIISGCGEKFM